MYFHLLVILQMESTDEMRPKVQKQHFKEENSSGSDVANDILPQENNGR